MLFIILKFPISVENNDVRNKFQKQTVFMKWLKTFWHFFATVSTSLYWLDKLQFYKVKNKSIQKQQQERMHRFDPLRSCSEFDPLILTNQVILKQHLSNEQILYFGLPRIILVKTCPNKTRVVDFFLIFHAPIDQFPRLDMLWFTELNQHFGLLKLCMRKKIRRILHHDLVTTSQSCIVCYD